MVCPFVMFSKLWYCEFMILSAGIVVVRKEKQEWKYLFLRAYRNWDFPKGLVEPSEDPIDTAKREVQEEAGGTPYFDLTPLNTCIGFFS